MRYDHIVKKNGVYYKAGEEILEGSSEKLPSADIPKTEAVKMGKVYTKTDINRLPKDELVSLATEKGVENASELSGNELKAKLISILGL